MTAPRGLSQPPTSFIGSQCQGIHHAPLNTYKHKTNIRNCTSENTNQPTTSPPKGRRPGRHTGCCSLDARNHYPQIKHHTPPPSEATTTTPTHWAPLPKKRRTPPVPHKQGEEVHGPVVSKPNSVFDEFPAGPHPQGGAPESRHVCCAPEPTPLQGAAHPTNRLSHRTPTICGRAQVSWCSLERR